MRLTRRRITSVIATAALTAMLVSCGTSTGVPDDPAPAGDASADAGQPADTAAGSDAGAAAGSDAASDASAEGEPVSGGVLKYAIDIQPAAGGIDPMVATALAAQTIMDLSYESLLTKNADGDIEPGLALSYEQPDDKHFVFKLRENAKFADGTPFTAADVVYSFETYQAAKTSKKAYLIGLEKIEAVDDYTVEFAFSEPNGTFLNAVSNRETFLIVNESGYGKASEDDRQKQSYGTGPFQVTEWKDGVSIAFEKNEHYWDSGKPYLDGIEMPIIPDESTRLAALQQGTVDAAWFADGTIAEQAESAGFTMGEPSYTQSLPIFLNPESGPLADVRVRQAVSLSLDRQQLADVAMFGYAKVSLVLPAGDPAAPLPDENTPNYTRDVEKAKQLLAEAGQPNPTIELSYFSDVVQNQHPIYEIMQQQMAEAGIELKLVGKPTAELAPIFTAGETFKDMVSLPWSYRADPTFYFDPFLSEAGAMNHWKDNPQADEARELLAKAKSETDVEAQSKLVSELADLAAEQVLVLVPLTVAYKFEAWNGDKLHGYSSDPYVSRYNLTDAWVTP